MSHFVAIKTQIKDQKALRAACAEMNLPVEDNAIARGWNGRSMAAPMIIRLPGPYDIAVTPQKDGTFELQTDWYQGHTEKVVGKDYGKLIQLYGVHKATAASKALGYLVQRKTTATGAIKLVVSGV